MKTIGFTPWFDSKANVNERWDVNGYFEQFRAEVQIDFDTEAYNVIRDTHRGVINSVKKYDHDPCPPPSFRKDVWEAAMRDTLQDYAFLAKQCRVKERGEVILDPDTSPGPVYKWLGARAKIDGIKDFPHIDKWLWDSGWRQSYPILWKQAGKVELVKRKKLVNNDIRGFTVAPLDFVIYCGRLFQDFDEKLSLYANQHGHNPTKVGMVMQHGGFSAWGKYLDALNWRKISEDIVKYDKTWGHMASQAPREVRIMAYDRASMTLDEFTDRIDYAYEQDVESFILLPNGEVVWKQIWLNSGKVATSYDGSISHTAQSHYVFRRVSGINADPNGYTIQKKHYKFGLYSDDKNSAISPTYAEKFTFEARNAAYQELGMSLDPEKDVDSYTLTGHQWLGKTFDLRDGHYVPVANRSKILCSLRNMESQVSDEIHVARALALMVEGTFTDAFDQLRAYVLWLQNRVTVDLPTDTEFEKWLAAVPTRAQCIRFWLGQELDLD